MPPDQKPYDCLYLHTLRTLPTVIWTRGRGDVHNIYNRSDTDMDQSEDRLAANTRVAWSLCLGRTIVLGRAGQWGPEGTWHSLHLLRLSLAAPCGIDPAPHQVLLDLP